MKIKLFLLFLFTLLQIKSLFGQSDESWKVYDDSQVAKINITMNQEDLNYMYEFPQSDSIHLAKVSFKNALIDETIDSIGIRIRGNTSRESYKKSIKLSFNSFIKGGKFYSLEKLNLNGEHNDPSIVRSKLCWDFFNNTCVISSRAAYAEIYINDKYYGLYISIEHIDENFLKKNYLDDSGNLWKCLFGADLVFLGNNPDLYKFVNNSGARPYDLRRNEEEDDYSKLSNLIYHLNSTSNPNYEATLESVLEVKNILKYFATNILVGGWDDYWSLSNNYYLYHNPTTDKFTLIPYDYDNTFGVTWWTHINWQTVNPYTFGKIVSGPRPLAEKLILRPKYRNLYSHFLEYYSETFFDTEIFINRLSELRNLITPFAQTDTFRVKDWGYSYQDFLNSFDQENYFFENGVIIPGSITDFVKERTNSLKSQINYIDHPPIIYDLNLSSTKLQADEQLLIFASVFSHKGLNSVRAEFVINGGTPEIFEFDYSPVINSLIVEEADQWKLTLPAFGESKNILLKILAEDNNGEITIYPNEGIEIITPSVVSQEILFSELMSLNSATIQDNAGEYEDWLELYNPQEIQIDLSGKFLTDKRDNLTKWQFPEGTVIDADNYKLFWCDEDQEQGNNHTNFKLTSQGEFLALVDSDGISIIDSIGFPSLNEDESYARKNNIGDWFISTSPTPGKSNIITDIEKNTILKNSNSLKVYPNPFNPSTNIEYQISKQMEVELKIYDLLGREVWTLNNEIKSAGTYSVLWNGTDYVGRDLSSGIYFLSINGKFFNKTIKLLLLR